MAEMGRIQCIQCGVAYQPRARGFNAKYCSDKCKRRNQRQRLANTKPRQRAEAKNRYYERIKRDPIKLAKHRARRTAYQAVVKKWLWEYKLSHGCTDCGYNQHPAALQLDHEGKKSIEIGDARSSIKRLQTEIRDGKCVVRCANCHSIKSYERKVDKDRWHG